jgi:SAM-dependent methyltransferase
VTASSGIDTEQGYAPGYEPGITDLFRFRSAERFARHLLPHLRPGMRVLDGGSGPGTITVGLGRRVAPGEVLGIDRDANQIAAATTAAQQAGVPNVRFEAGDILHLPCPDVSVDVVHFSCVLTHLPTPLEVLKEAWRVLKPGGIVSVREPVFASTIWCPENSLLIEACQLIIRAIQHAGGDANRGKHLGVLLHGAGYGDLHLSATYDGPREPAERPRFCALLAGTFAETHMARLLVAQGWANQSHLEEIIGAIRALGNDPRGFVAVPHIEALGWKIQEDRRS